jgi:hypothetical protein
MIILRELKDKDVEQAIQLKALCWPEELAGMSDHKLYRSRVFLLV